MSINQDAAADTTAAETTDVAVTEATAVVAATEATAVAAATAAATDADTEVSLPFKVFPPRRVVRATPEPAKEASKISRSDQRPLGGLPSSINNTTLPLTYSIY